MSVTLQPMSTKKSVQVRIPTDLSNDIAAIAPTLGMTATEYVEHYLRAAVEKDLPAAVKKLQTRLDHKKGSRGATP